MRKILYFITALTGWFIISVAVGLLCLMIITDGDLAVCIQRIDVSIPCAFIILIGMTIVTIASFINPKNKVE